jgi:hypothetical protein
MTATVNTAALFWQQFDIPAIDDTPQIEPLPCTIFNVIPTGYMVDVFVRDTANGPAQTPNQIWTERNVLWVDIGDLPPASGYFVTPTNWTLVAPAPTPTPTPVPTPTPTPTATPTPTPTPTATPTPSPSA